MTAISAPQLLDRYPTRQVRVERYDELARDLAEVFAAHPRAHWLPLLEAHDVPFAPERRLHELADDPQVQHLDVFYSLTHPEQGVVRAAHRPVRFDGDHRSDFRPPPTLGEHTLQVLREAGLSPQAIARLQEQGVIG